MYETCFKVHITLAQITELMNDCAKLVPRHTPSFRAILQQEMGEHWMISFGADRRDSDNLVALYQLKLKYTVTGSCSLMVQG